TTHHGVAHAEIGEEGERLLALGHPTDRQVLAAINAYHRSIGHRLVPGAELNDLVPYGIRRTWGIASHGADENYAWVIDDAAPEHPDAQPVTWINHEHLDHQDVAVQEQCPQCDHPSRSTAWGWGPGRRTGGPHHTCKACEYRWPAAPVYRVSLWKPRRREYPADPADCFACHCGPHFLCSTAVQPPVRPCSGITADPIVGHPLCANCRDQFPPDTWHQLVAAGYGTTHRHSGLAEQRDLWLVLRTRNGIAPTEAALEWEQRLALTARRAR
ncbi:hypothetical protein, partial [Streptomyces sp. NPDC058103]|uniref:hypothetical protein n=1 Tax=Streptomyces sp. NPDC058103 TaxID=3346341 RepID=UPI0036E0E5DC